MKDINEENKSEPKELNNIIFVILALIASIVVSLWLTT